MKAVILAGGLGTRLSEETNVRPKPMVEIGGRPLLWHIMKTYSFHGVNDFVICCGYKGYMIKEYFANYFLHVSDVTFDIAENQMEVHRERAEPWRVTLVDTGDATLTGGRLRRIAEYVADDEAFCMTYGDGLADIDVTALIEFHGAHGRKATVTATEDSVLLGLRRAEVRSLLRGEALGGAMAATQQDYSAAESVASSGRLAFAPGTGINERKAAVKAHLGSARRAAVVGRDAAGCCLGRR